MKCEFPEYFAQVLLKPAMREIIKMAKLKLYFS
jgi:hypothetical protein